MQLSHKPVRCAANPILRVENTGRFCLSVCLTMESALDMRRSVAGCRVLEKSLNVLQITDSLSGFRKLRL